MTVRYRSATLGEFIEHHSYDVSRGGMFIKTPSPFPPGTLLKFEVKIADEQRLMQGVGRVVWKREEQDASTDSPAGMGVKFIKIDDASQALIERLVDSRGDEGPGAFDRSSRSDSQRMFPDTGTAHLPTPEQPTDLTPGSGHPPQVSEAEAGVDRAGEKDEAETGFSSDQPETASQGDGAEVPTTSTEGSESGSSRRKTNSQDRVTGRHGRGASGDQRSGDREKGDNRAFIALVLVAVVALVVYLLSRSDDHRATTPKGETDDALRVVPSELGKEDTEPIIAPATEPAVASRKESVKGSGEEPDKAQETKDDSKEGVESGASDPGRLPGRQATPQRVVSPRQAPQQISSGESQAAASTKSSPSRTATTESAADRAAQKSASATDAEPSASSSDSTGSAEVGKPEEESSQGAETSAPTEADEQTDNETESAQKPEAEEEMETP